MASLVDGIILTLGTIYVVFFSPSFIGPFQSFLITLGVPLAAWAGIMMADITLRRRPYDEASLFDASGRYGFVNWIALSLMALCCFVGWGLVVNGFDTDAPWNNWQGYILDLGHRQHRSDHRPGHGILWLRLAVLQPGAPPRNPVRPRGYLRDSRRAPRSATAM